MKLLTGQYKRNAPMSMILNKTGDAAFSTWKYKHRKHVNKSPLTPS